MTAMQYRKVLAGFILSFFGIVSAVFAVEPFVVQISPTFVAPPSVSYEKSLRGGDPVRQEFVNEWLMITVRFDVEYEKTTVKKTSGKQGNTYSSLYKNEWLDRVQLDVRMIIDTGEGGATQHKKSSNRYVYMSGETEFWTINLKTKHHVARFFVPAQLLDRFAYDPAPIRANRGTRSSGPGPLSTKLQKFRPRQFFIEAEFKHQGQTVGLGYYHYGKLVYGTRGRVSKTSAEFTRLLGNVSTHCKWDNAILPRAFSPWALHRPNYYDTEKLPDSKPGI